MAKRPWESTEESRALRNAAVRKEWLPGRDAKGLAHKYRISTRTVYRIVVDMPRRVKATADPLAYNRAYKARKRAEAKAAKAAAEEAHQQSVK